jgi:6-phosphofructokinase 1
MRGTDIVRVSFEEALGELNTVPLYRYEEAAALFG